MNKSVWSKYLKQRFNSLDKDIKCDVLIIGGGLSGVLTSYYLNNSNLDIVLVERNTLGSGVTSRMTAKVTYLQDILTNISDKHLKLYLKSQMEGMELLKTNIENEKIKCDFLENDSYLYTNCENNLVKLEKIKSVLGELKIKYREDEFPFKEIKCLKSINTNSYEINPIKYLNGIVSASKNIKFYENTNIVKVEKKDNCFISYTSNNKKIISKKVIFATNYPNFLKPLFFPLKVHLEKSYIGYGEYEGHLDKINLINIDKKIKSIRFYNKKMIYLTNSKKLNKKTDDAKCFSEMFSESLIKKHDTYWSNIDLITNDYLPIAGSIIDNLYILTGYNTWGVLSSHICSKLVASLVLKEKKYLKLRELFNPRMKFEVKKFLNSTINIYDNISGFIKGYITSNDTVFYTKDTATYVDFDGKSYTVKRKCPHLKCNLIFNSLEKTWDCPCHGSRFDLSGNVILGPSSYSIKIKEDNS